jgi:L-glutamine-phosphate cytidylyltransferase
MNDLKVIILAAGEGKRLRPLTENIPKCMVNFFGKSILKRQIDIFKNLDISDISVVTGYCDNKIDLDNITKFKNKNFMTTNMVESLFTAEEKLDDSVIVSYGDIIFEPNIIQSLIDSRHDISIVVDKNWKDLWNVRFENPLDDAESLKIDNRGYISDIGQNTKNIEDIEGQFIGLIKIQGDGLKILKSSYEKFREQAIKENKNPLNPNVSFEKSYMTDFLQGLIKDNHKLTPVFVNNGWLELDSMKDYEIYNKMFKNKKILEFIDLENLN